MGVKLYSSASNYQHTFLRYLDNQQKIEDMSDLRESISANNPKLKDEAFDAFFENYCQRQYGYRLQDLEKQSETLLDELVSVSRKTFADKAPVEIWDNRCLFGDDVILDFVGQMFHPRNVFSPARRKHYIQSIKKSAPGAVPTPRELETSFLSD